MEEELSLCEFERIFKVTGVYAEIMQNIVLSRDYIFLLALGDCLFC